MMRIALGGFMGELVVGILLVLVVIAGLVIGAVSDNCPYGWTSMCLDCPMGGKYRGCVFTGEVEDGEGV